MKKGLVLLASLSVCFFLLAFETRADDDKDKIIKAVEYQFSNHEIKKLEKDDAKTLGRAFKGKLTQLSVSSVKKQNIGEYTIYFAKGEATVTLKSVEPVTAGIGTLVYTYSYKTKVREDGFGDLTIDLFEKK